MSCVCTSYPVTFGQWDCQTVLANQLQEHTSMKTLHTVHTYTSLNHCINSATRLHHNIYKLHRSHLVCAQCKDLSVGLPPCMHVGVSGPCQHPSLQLLQTTVMLTDHGNSMCRVSISQERRTSSPPSVLHSTVYTHSFIPLTTPLHCAIHPLLLPTLFFAQMLAALPTTQPHPRGSLAPTSNVPCVNPLQAPMCSQWLCCASYSRVQW